MKKLIILCIKRICKFAIAFFQTLKSLILIVLKTNKCNQTYRTKYAGILTILANGPSLKNDIERIDVLGRDFSVLNFFYKSPWFRKLRPKYYVIADPEFFKNNNYLRPFVKVLEEIDWDMTLYIPYVWRNVEMLRSIQNRYINIITYNAQEYNGFECLRFPLYERGLSMPRVQNVLVASIFLGINMGYKTIKLYGADHSWTKTLGVNSENQVCAVDSHFYDTQPVSFTPYWKDPVAKTTYTIDELLKSFAKMFESYHVLRRYADYRGCKILNCTKDSFIDAFDRVHTCKTESLVC